jgi:hypothetical protein
MGWRGAVQIGSGFLAVEGARSVVQGDHSDSEHPRKLTVTFRDGQVFIYNYPSREDRDRFLLAIAGALAPPPQFAPLGSGHVRVADVSFADRWDSPGRGPAEPPGFHVRAVGPGGATVADKAFGTAEERDLAYEALLRRLEGEPRPGGGEGGA